MFRMDCPGFEVEFGVPYPSHFEGRGFSTDSFKRSLNK